MSTRIGLASDGGASYCTWLHYSGAFGSKWLGSTGRTAEAAVGCRGGPQGGGGSLGHHSLLLLGQCRIFAPPPSPLQSAVGLRGMLRLASAARIASSPPREPCAAPELEFAFIAMAAVGQCRLECKADDRLRTWSVPPPPQRHHRRGLPQSGVHFRGT